LAVIHTLVQKTEKLTIQGPVHYMVPTDEGNDYGKVCFSV